MPRKLLKIIILLCFLSLCKVKAQNLVPNWQIEAPSTCDQGYCWFNDPCMLNWQWTFANPDYMHVCNVPDIGVPNNHEGFQWPRSGRGYAHISIRNLNGSHGREAISVRLTDQLTVGNQYCLKFWVSLTDLSRYGTNGIGVTFSMDSLLSESVFDRPFIEPLINFYQDPPVLNKKNWRKMEASFIADSAYLYVHVGGLAHLDSMSMVLDTTGPSDGASIYLDDFAVFPCSSLKTADAGDTAQYVCANAVKPVQIGAEPAPGHAYFWWPSEGLSSDTVANPTVRISKNITYYLRTIDFTNDTTYDSIQLFAVNCEIQLPNIITPNGDMMNDMFIIEGLAEGSKLQVFNRWGKLVFEDENYQNNWSGTDNNGQPLTEGVYFVSLSNRENLQTASGYVHVVR